MMVDDYACWGEVGVWAWKGAGLVGVCEGGVLANVNGARLCTQFQPEQKNNDCLKRREQSFDL